MPAHAEIVIVKQESPFTSHYGFDGWEYCRRGLILMDDKELTQVEFEESDVEGNA